MFSLEDLAYAKGLKKILEDGTFPLKKREVSTFAKVLVWADGLEGKIKESIEKEKMKPIKKAPAKKKAAKKPKLGDDGK